MNEVKIVEGFKCVECGDEFFRFPTFGYCDNTLACASSDGESIQPLS
jgi:hypothetical protein